MRCFLYENCIIEYVWKQSDRQEGIRSDGFFCYCSLIEFERAAQTWRLLCHSLMYSWNREAIRWIAMLFLQPPVRFWKHGNSCNESDADDERKGFSIYTYSLSGLLMPVFHLEIKGERFHFQPAYTCFHPVHRFPLIQQYRYIVNQRKSAALLFCLAEERICPMISMNRNHLQLLFTVCEALCSLQIMLYYASS